MAEGEDAFVAATQETLGKLISKPKMTDKYLKKPPFRFLHDIVSEVTKATTFGQGLFTPEEMDASKLTEKPQKVEFLNKAISVVSFALGEKVDVSANKIVAGLEPEKTNAWLVKLHSAATTCAGAKSDEAVQRVLSGETAAAPKKEKKKEKKEDKKDEAPPADAPPPADGGDDAAAAEAEEKKKKDEARRKKREEEKKRKAAEEAAAAGGEAPPPPPDGGGDAAADEEAARKAKKDEERRKKDEDRKKREERKKAEKEAAAAAAAAEEEARRQADADAQAQAAAAMQAEQEQAEAAAQAAAAQAAAAQAAAEEQQMQQQQSMRASPPPDHMPDGGMTSAPGSAQMGVRPSVGGQGPSAEDIAANAAGMMGEQDMRRPERPRTAGRRPPKQQSKVQTSAEQTAAAAPAPVIFAEGAKDDDEDDCFETPEGQSGLGFGGSVKAGAGAVHGKLVNSLLAEQKKEEEERIKREEENTREEFDEGGKKGIRMGKLKLKDKNKDAQIAEVDTVKLGEIIQSLCQAANPLGKSIDLVNEDIANMGKELDKWKNEYRQASDDYQSQLRQTEEILQPLYQKVAELDDKIAEQRAKIRNSRSRICQNDEKISLLLESVVSNQRH